MRNLKLSVTAAILSSGLAAFALTRPSNAIAQNCASPDLGTAYEYIGTKQNAPVAAPPRVIVVKDPETIVTVTMGDDIAVSPLFRRSRMADRQPPAASPKEEASVFSDGSTLELRPRLANRPSLAAKLDSAPIVTADLGSAPTTTADLVSAPIVTVEMGKDDLAVTPLPGYPPRR